MLNLQTFVSFLIEWPSYISGQLVLNYKMINAANGGLWPNTVENGLKEQSEQKIKK